MTSRTQGAVLLLFGVVCARLALSDVYLRYVNAWMKTPLLITAAVLLVLAARTVITIQAPRDEPADTPVAAWLMLLPILAVFVISPPALGAYAAERNTVVVASDDEFAMLPLDENGVISMSLSEFASRAQWDNTLTGRKVALTGFVSKDKTGAWFITRLAMSCCAADAVAYQIQVAGVDEPARDAWIRVTGTWERPATKDVPRIKPPPLLQAESMEPVPAPRNTYE